MKCLPYILTVFVAVLLVAAEKKGEQTRAKDLAPPVRITAGGKPIVVDGYASPFLGDMDGDGKIDLLVGQYDGGKLRIYRNIGTNARPKFGKFEWFKAGGDLGRTFAGCYTGFSPQLIDFDHDGRTDILTGSFYGHLYMFSRNKNGIFSESQILKDKSSNLIRITSHNSSVFVHDWDSDGDLDLLVGSSSGRLRLLPNEGSNKKPAFAEPQALIAGGEPIGGFATCIADWDSDGKDDLLVGRSSGVLWYRNVGEKSKPVLEAPVTLVPKNTNLNDKPGRIVKISVVDFNGDGRLDLLVGDTGRLDIKIPELTDKQEADRKDARARSSSLNEAFSNLNKVPKDETDEARVERQDKIAKNLKQLINVKAELDRLNPYMRRKVGYVWLFERLAK